MQNTRGALPFPRLCDPYTLFLVHFFFLDGFCDNLFHLGKKLVKIKKRKYPDDNEDELDDDDEEEVEEVEEEEEDGDVEEFAFVLGHVIATTPGAFASLTTRMPEDDEDEEEDEEEEEDEDVERLAVTLGNVIAATAGAIDNLFGGEATSSGVPHAFVSTLPLGIRYVTLMEACNVGMAMMGNDDMDEDEEMPSPPSSPPANQ